MRGITGSSKTSTLGGVVRAGLAPAVVACALATACSRTPASPVAPAVSQASPPAAVSSPQGTSQSWQEFEARGWNCRRPAPAVVVCSAPGQPLPAVAIPPAQPPADRPPTVMLKRWINDVFDANVLLIRPEIYNGQPCGSTGLPYTFIGVLGYYECVHIVGN